MIVIKRVYRKSVKPDYGLYRVRFIYLKGNDGIYVSPRSHWTYLGAWIHVWWELRKNENIERGEIYHI